MELTWKIALALIGLLFARNLLYVKTWGHGGAKKKLIGVLIGGACLYPLVQYNDTGVTIAVIAAVIILTPYRRILMALFLRKTRKSLQKLAAEYGAESLSIKVPDHSLQPNQELFTIRGTGGTGQHPFWIGNVLTEARSIHPSVKTSQMYYMMCFVVELKTAPSFQCAIFRGFSNPKFFNEQWRYTSMMQGGMVSLDMSETMREHKKPTGGDASLLTLYKPDYDTRFQNMQVITDNEAAFDLFFDADLRDKFFESANTNLQYEFDITPSSVVIYTTYCSYEVQKNHIELLLEIAGRLGG